MPHPISPDRHWFVVGRWQEYDGEVRANLLRIVGIASFYVLELINYRGLSLGLLELPPVQGVDEAFHRAVTALAAAWVAMALAVHLCLRRGVFPGGLKYLSTAGDLALLTCVLLVADGGRSPLVVGYFLIVALSALRFSVSLVRMATLGAILGYLVVLGYARWFEPADRLPRYQQLTFLVAVVLCGVVVGQVVRRVRRLAEDYAQRVGGSAP